MPARYKKYIQMHVYDFYALIIIVLAALLRISLLYLGWPPTNSDEGTMGIMALHIAHGQDYPVFFYGQNYMGSLEAYLGASLFYLIGPSLFALRLGLVCLFSLFLLTLYFLTKLLYTKKYALASIILLSFGSTEMLTRELKALGGVVETMLFGTLILLITSWLVLPSLLTSHRSRVAAYGLLGLVMGLGIWSHMLVVPFVCVSFVLLFLFCRAERRTRTTLSLVLGLLIGLFPLLLYNVEYPLQNSLVTIWQLHRLGGGPELIPFTFWDQIVGSVLLSLPMATSAPYLCPVSADIGEWRSQISSCMVAQGLWGAGFLVLGFAASFLFLQELRSVYASYKVSEALDEKRSVVLCTLRLMVLGSAGLTLLAYVLSPAPALFPTTSARYLVGLLVALPTILTPLWRHISTIASAPSRRTVLITIIRYSLFALIGCMLAAGTLSAFQQTSAVQAQNQQRKLLIADLLRLHATRIYSDYWTCDDIIFQTNERIICSVIDENFQSGSDRYVPYYSIVQHDPHAAYVFHANSPQASFMRKVPDASKFHIIPIASGYLLFERTTT